jgi:hypothetical protein
LIYKITLPGDVMLFFTHFSLQKSIRHLQFVEIRNMIQSQNNDVIILADFNVLQGLGEVKMLIDELNLKLLNDEEDYTFTFHRTRRVLDLCLCSANIADRVSLRILPQPFSDHAALLVSYDPPAQS